MKAPMYLFLILILLGIGCGEVPISNQTTPIISATPAESDTVYRYSRKRFNWTISNLDTSKYELDISSNGKELIVRDSILSLVPYNGDSLLLDFKIVDIHNRKTIQTEAFKFEIHRHPLFNDEWYEFKPGERITPLLEGQGHLAYNWNNYRLEGKKAPSINSMTVQGQNISLDSLKGKVIFLNSWYYGCLPCMAEIPTLNKLYQNFQNDTNVVFISLFKDDAVFNPSSGRIEYHNAMFDILEGDALEELKRSLRSKNDQIKFHLIPNAEEIQKRYNVMAYPTNLIIGKHGSIEHIHIGAFENGNDILLQKWSKEINRLLQK